MKSSRCILLLASLIASTLIAQDDQVTPLMSKDLADFPGKEGLMITVVYPPGASDPIHRHNAHAYVYVLGWLRGDAGERRQGTRCGINCACRKQDKQD
jgi:hypothetical protein